MQLLLADIKIIINRTHPKPHHNTLRVPVCGEDDAPALFPLLDHIPKIAPGPRVQTL